jgi:hypothetical protein
VLNVLNAVLQTSDAAAAAAAGGGFKSIYNFIHCPVPYGMYCNLQQQNKTSVAVHPTTPSTLPYSTAQGVCRKTLKASISVCRNSC